MFKTFSEVIYVNKLNKELLKANIEKIAEYDLKNHKLFGSAYFIMQDNEVIYNNCFGATSKSGTNPVTEKTIFRLASMTKPITAIATLILVDRGLLSLSDKVADYLPEFKNVHVSEVNDLGEVIDLGKPKKDITILNLLNHTAGIGCSVPKLQKMTAENDKTLENSVKFFAKSGLDFEPESKQQYSGTGAFDLLAKIIEKVTDTDYQEFLKKEIFAKCDMPDTAFVPTDEQWSRVIAMHNRIDGENCEVKMRENCVFFNTPCTHYLGGAGLVSTIADYSNFAKMLLNNGETPNGKILTEETFKLLHTPTVPKEIMPNNERWGLAVRIVVNDAYKVLPVGAYGWSGAYGSHFWIDPTNKVAAVFMKNSLIDGGSGNESARNFEKAVNDSFNLD